VARAGGKEELGRGEEGKEEGESQGGRWEVQEAGEGGGGGGGEDGCGGRSGRRRRRRVVDVVVLVRGGV